MGSRMAANIPGAEHTETRETYPVLGLVMTIGAWRLSLDAS